jgi:hypothetical protein
MLRDHPQGESMDQIGAKIFSVEEANRLIPRLEQSLDALATTAREASALRRELTVLSAIAVTGATSQSDDIRELAEKAAREKELLARFREQLAEVVGCGCIVRDLEIGLVDFYALARDRIICLCWRRGESEIGHWHPVDQGFTGRRPLSEPP